MYWLFISFLSSSFFFLSQKNHSTLFFTKRPVNLTKTTNKQHWTCIQILINFHKHFGFYSDNILLMSIRNHYNQFGREANPSYICHSTLNIFFSFDSQLWTAIVEICIYILLLFFLYSLLILSSNRFGSETTKRQKVFFSEFFFYVFIIVKKIIHKINMYEL